MATVKVLNGFFDMKEGCNRSAGEEFEASEERAKELVANLPEGFVEVAVKPKAEKPKKEAKAKVENKD